MPDSLRVELERRGPRVVANDLCGHQRYRNAAVGVVDVCDAPRPTPLRDLLPDGRDLLSAIELDVSVGEANDDDGVGHAFLPVDQAPPRRGGWRSGRHLQSDPYSPSRERF